MTPAQLDALAADIALDQALAALPKNSDSAVAVANAYNLPASPQYLVWRSDASTTAILDAVDMSKYTPNDAADGTATYTNRVLLAQTKQMNLQLMTQGRTSLDATKAALRSSLRDAVINLPTGSAGVNTQPGGASGATVLAACLRPATRAEKLFSPGTATTGTTVGGLMNWEGGISGVDVEQAWGV